MEKDNHQTLETQLSEISEIFAAQLNSEARPQILKNLYMNLYTTGYNSASNAKCAESSVREIKVWFRNYVRRYYKNLLEITGDLEGGQESSLFVGQVNRVFDNFSALSRFMNKTFLYFNRDITVKLYNLEGGLVL